MNKNYWTANKLPSQQAWYLVFLKQYLRISEDFFGPNSSSEKETKNCLNCLEFVLINSKLVPALTPPLFLVPAR